MKRRLTIACLLATCIGHGVQAAEPARLDVPMGHKLISVKILCGLKDKKPTSWEGAYAVTGGRIIATDSWRFRGDDYATVSKFKFNSNRFFHLFWKMRGQTADKAPMRPNGVILTIADVGKASALEVKTNHGDFTAPIGRIGFGRALMRLQGQVEVQRVPTSRLIVKSPTEDVYPSAAAGADGALYVAYLAFTHGEGFRSRPPIKKPPEDFTFLTKPTGGDQLMFTEMKAGQWTAPEPLTPPGQDLFGTAAAVDGQGRVWVLWAGNDTSTGRDNWQVYATVREAGQWAKPMCISMSPGSDFFVVAATDSQGRVWAAWQSFGKTNSDILVAQQEGLRFGKPTAVASSPANEWKPAIAASKDGQVAVAWDSYEAGNYDLLARVWAKGEWGPTHTIAASAQNETRASLAYDPQGRLWIAYEENPEGWGKDFGPYDQSPKRLPLYRKRRIGLRVLAGDQLLRPKANVNLSMPMPNGNRRWPKAKGGFLFAGPQIGVDATGRVWVSARVRMARFMSWVGTTWVNFVTTLDGKAWRLGAFVPESDGFLHETPALVPAPGSGMYLVASSDNRFRTAAFFGPGMWKAMRRSKGALPATTRTIPRYPDTWQNKEIAVSDTGRLAPPSHEYELAPVSPGDARELSAEAQTEAQHVAAIQGYRTSVAGKTYRILRGEFHRHTELSSDGGGDGTIFDMWRYAIDMAGMDWIGNGDHDNGGGREFTWWFTQKTTSIFNVPGAFTSMYTYERSCNYPDGHRNVVFARRGIRPLARLKKGMGKAMDDLPADAPRPNTPDTQMLYRYLRQLDGVCASHTSGTNMGTDWRDNDPKVEPIVEIYQGDRQSYERPGAPRTNSAEWSLGGWRPMGFVSRALMKGYRLGFESSSDHISTHMSYCNVFVEKPTREAILDAMKKRRIYGATENIIADVRSAGHFMGEEFAVQQPPTIEVKLIGTAPFAEVVIVKDNEYVYSASPMTREVSFKWTDRDARPGKTSYYYVRGTQVGQKSERKIKGSGGKRISVAINNGEIVWVSPMWITYRP